MWNNIEDVQQDMALYSEIEGIDTIQEPPPPSVVEYNARIGTNRNSSIYDIPYYEETDDSTIIVSNIGRGKGRGRFNMYRPGNMAQNINLKDDDEDIRLRLKAVTGIGHSNEMIEERYRQKTGKSSAQFNTKINNETEFCDANELKIQYLSPNSSPSRNSKSSKSSSRSTPNLDLPNQNGTSNSGSSIDLNVSDPCIIEEEININSLDFPPLGSESGRSSRSESVHSSKSGSVHSPFSSSPIPPTNQPLASEDSVKLQAPSALHDVAPQGTLPLSLLRRLAKEKKIRHQPVAVPVPAKVNSDKEYRSSKSPNMTNGKTNNKNSPKSSKMNDKESSSAPKMNGNSFVAESNEYWWPKKTQTEEPLAWRRRNNSPARFFNNQRTDVSKYDIKSKSDFPSL